MLEDSKTGDKSNLLVKEEKDNLNNTFEEKFRETSDFSTETEIVQCYFCDYVTQRSELKIHINQVHGGSDQPVVYRPIIKKLRKETSTQQQDKSENVNKQLNCKQNMAENSEKIVSTQSRTIIQCHICHKIFKNNSRLSSHMVTAHSEERNFSCSHCDLKFKISAVLTRHIKRVHKKELNYICDLCGKKLFDAWRLKIHKESHARGKIYMP